MISPQVRGCIKSDDLVAFAVEDNCIFPDKIDSLGNDNR